MNEGLHYRLRDRSQRLWVTEQDLLDNNLFREAADSIEELVKERDEYEEAAKVWQEDFIQENQRLYVTTVKLAIAVESIKQSIKLWEKPDGGDRLSKLDNAYDGFELLCKALAELEGEDD